MFKNFKSITAATLALICVGLTSCSDDNDEPNPDVNVTTGNANPATVFTQGVPSAVGDFVITKNADGLVTKIVDDEDVYTFDYTGAKAKSRATRPTDYDMTMNVAWGNDEDGVDFFIKLNAQGYIEYAYEEDEDEYDGLQVDEWWFKYNTAGQLIEMKRTEGDNEVTTITYNADGDITKVSVSDDEDGNKMETTVSYTDATHKNAIVNKSGIMLYDDSFRIDMDEMAPAYYAGLLGKGTKHLPLSAVEKDLRPGNEEYVDNYSFKWEFNASEMPIKFTSSYTSYWGTETDDPIIFKW